jgi:chromosomal replication initiation ATPase DnaA
MHMLLSIEEQKIKRKREAEELPYTREAILTSLLIDVADAFNVPLKIIKAGDQQQLTVLVRTLFYYVARMKTDYGLKSLAWTAGRKDHSGCIQQLKKVQAFFYHKDNEFLALWDHYLTNSNLFTSKDF